IKKYQPVDMINLDIVMPYIYIIELLSRLTNQPKIIIVSVYEQYAFKDFELEGSDYLLKHVSFERFFKAVNKVYNGFTKEKTIEHQPESIFVRTNQKYEKVDFEDILFVEALDNYISIHTLKKKYITHTTLSSFIQRLPSQRFVQIHKSYVINVEKVTSLEGNLIGIETCKLPISKSYRSVIK